MRIPKLDSYTVESLERIRTALSNATLPTWLSWVDASLKRAIDDVKSALAADTETESGARKATGAAGPGSRCFCGLPLNHRSICAPDRAHPEGDGPCNDEECRRCWHHSVDEYKDEP